MNVKTTTPALPENWFSQNLVQWVKCPFLFIDPLRRQLVLSCLMLFYQKKMTVNRIFLCP